jgi:hypothetical protein
VNNADFAFRVRTLHLVAAAAMLMLALAKCVALVDSSTEPWLLLSRALPDSRKACVGSSGNCL